MSDAAAVSAPAAAPAPSAPAASPAPSAPSTPTPSPAASSSAPASPSIDASAASTPAAAAKRKIIVNGSTMEVDDVPQWLADSIGEDGALSLRRLRAAGQTSMQEAAKMRAEAEARLTRLKSPESMMEGLMELYGGNAEAIDAAMERFYTQRLREQEMTPEQRELAQLRREREQHTKTREQQESEAKAARSKAVREEYAAKGRAALPSALQAAGLPHTKVVVQRVAAAAQEAIRSGEDVDDVMNGMDRIARSVKAEMLEEWRELHGAMDPEALAGILGDERLKALRARDVERLKAAQAGAAPAVRAPDGRFAKPVAAAAETRVGTAQWFRDRRR